MNNKTEQKAAPGASVAKAETKAVLTVVAEKEPKKTLDNVFSKLAELKRAERYHTEISGKISDLQNLNFEEGNRNQSLTIVDVEGNSFTVNSETFLNKVVDMLLDAANKKKAETEQYILTAQL